MLLERSTGERAGELTRLITEAIHKGRLDHDQMDALLQRYPRRPGVANLKGAYVAYMPKPSAQSHLELAFDDERRANHPDIPEPVPNVRIGPWEIDRWWPQQRVAVELDGGPYHVAAADMERDREKDAWLLCRRISPLRITDTRFDLDRRACFDDLRALLALAAA